MNFNDLTLTERKQHKQCTICFKLKPLTDYWNRKNEGARKTYAYCKDCGKQVYSYYRRKQANN